MMPGTERAFIDLARAAPRMVNAVMELGAAINRFVDHQLSLPNDNVNEEPSEDVCDSCEGWGYDFFEEDDTGRIVLQRCDQCQKYESDQDAAIAFQPLLMKFLRREKKILSE